MEKRQKSVKLYNVLFPVWFLILLPQLWLIVLPGNFLIDSAVLLICMYALKMEDKKAFYKRHIFKIFAFGMLADFLGAALLFVTLILEIGTYGDELYLTGPAMLVAAGLIYVFNYFVTFRDCEKNLRRKLSLTYAIATAPYTFLIPSRWIY